MKTDDLFTKLWRRKIAVVAWIAAGVGIGLLIGSLQPPTYRSTALVEVQGVNDNLLNTKDVDPSASSFTLLAEQYLQTQIKIIHSESVIAGVVDRLGLVKHPELLQSETLQQRLQRLIGMPSNAEPPDRDTLVRWASENASARVAGETQVIEIAFEAPDAKLASDFANGIVNQFIESRLQVHDTAGQRTKEWLTSQIDGLKSKLTSSEIELQAYARSTGLLFMNEKDNLAEQRLRQLQEGLSRVHEARVAYESKYDLVNTAPPDSLPEVLDDPQLREYGAKLTDLRRQLAEVRPVLAPGHYKVQQLQSQINELQNAIESKRNNVLARIRNEFDAAVHQEKNLAASYAAQSQLVSEQSANVVHYDVLKRELDTNRQIYEAMLQKLREVGIASAMRASNIVVVDKARPASKPFRPKRSAYAAIGFGSGVFAGTLFAIYPPRRKRRLDGSRAVARLHGIPELGLIPLVREKRNSLTREPLLSSAATHAVRDRYQETMVSILLHGPQQRHSRTVTPRRARIIVISSCSNGEGRTTVASNLAIAFSHVNHKVLLIDADLRKPRLHTLFGIRNDLGLSDILSDTKPPDSYTAEQIGEEPETFPGLRVLGCGTDPAQGVGLLHSMRLAEFLIKAREFFDIVIVDTPPILSFSDARSLAKVSDGVGMVIRVGKTTEEQVASALWRYMKDRAPIVGTIVIGSGKVDPPLLHGDPECFYVPEEVSFGDPDTNALEPFVEFGAGAGTSNGSTR
jgi:capsular exopolysaccharide synthesis family protein